LDLPPPGLGDAGLGLDERYHVLAALEPDELGTLRAAQQAVDAA
jgi:hypothetical protein